MKQEHTKVETAKMSHPDIQNARELMGSGQFVEVLRLIETLPESIQETGWVQFMRARALMKTGDNEQSRIALDAALCAGMPEIPVLEIRSVLQEQINDQEGLLVTFARLVELDPNNVALHFRVARKMRDMGRAEEAGKAARTARDLTPDDPASHGLVCNIAVHFGDIKGFREALEYALAHLPGSLPSNVLSHLRMMPEQDVGDLTARIEARWQGSLSIRKSKRLPPAPQETWRRPLIQQQEEATLLCSPPGDNGITIVWFGGIGSDFNALLPVDTHAAAASCNAIYVNPKLAYYLPVNRSKDPLTALLRAEIAKFRTKKLIVSGTSLGAVPALFYGMALEADRMISLSGPTTGRPDQRAEMGDRRAPIIITSMQRELPLEQLDLRPAILAASKAKSRKPFRYDIYYGADRPTDRRQAERLADIRGVRLFPIEGFAEHHSFTGLIDRGREREIFTV